MSRKARREKRQRSAQKNYEKIQDERLEKLRRDEENTSGRAALRGKSKPNSEVPQDEIDWSQGWRGYLSQRSRVKDD